MADQPTASNTLGLIGVQLYRLHQGPVTAAINMVFAVVQPDEKWVAWYVFFSDASPTQQVSWIKGDEGTKAADHYGEGFGRTKDDFRRVSFHLAKPMRVDALAGKLESPALMFARNGCKKDRVLVDIEIQRPTGILTLRNMRLFGNIQKEFDAKSIRGRVVRLGGATIFDPKELKNPPWGSSPEFGSDE